MAADEHAIRTVEQLLTVLDLDSTQARTTEDIFTTVEQLRARGVKLQDTIETYYELVDQRVPGHGEDL